MKSKLIILITLSILTLITLPPLAASQESCFPNYECGEWGVCIEGLESRTCLDQTCGRRAIVERRFCDIPNCKPRIECLEWSECIYTEKINNLIEGEIGFGGYHNRICRDSTGCVESFTEEKPCEEFFPLELEKVRECGTDVLVATDPISQRQVAKINLNSWLSSGRLDITFIQGETTYCPQCYNGIQDSNEEDIDCGADCKPCVNRIVFPTKLAITTFWLLSILFSLFFIKEIINLKRTTT